LALGDWLYGSDPVIAWLQQGVGIILGKEAPKVRTKDAYQDFKIWAIAEGFKEMMLPAVNTFTQRVTASGKGIICRRDNKGSYMIGLSLHLQDPFKLPLSAHEMGQMSEIL
jgi:putative DNA primase/helicase